MKNKIIITTITLVTYILISNLVFAAEPAKPFIYSNFSREQEKQINKIRRLSIEEVIEELQGQEFLVNEDLLSRAIFVSFMNRRDEAIDFVLDYFELPISEVIDGKRINRGSNFFIGKKILQVFPDESFARISEVYNSSSFIRKTNIIQALGTMYGEEIKNFLIEALDDQDSLEEDDDDDIEIDGELMRICDVAYNQLVLRYEIKDVLRTISPAHTIEQRDSFIETLRGRL
ncbi:MAG: hypothetical protein ABIG56_03865 [Candidatus Omnitrophota bacterium]